MSRDPGSKKVYRTKIRIGPSGVKVTHPDEMAGSEPGPDSEAGVEGGTPVRSKTYHIRERVSLSLPGCLAGLAVLALLIVLVVTLLPRFIR